MWATDYRWWRHHIADISRDFEGNCYTIERDWPEDTPPESWGVKAFEANVTASGLSRDPAKINTLRNSGGAAIGLAYHLGAKRILLLGYDMQVDGEKRHWFGDHPTPEMNKRSDYGGFASSIATIRPDEYGLEIWNCTRQTALRCFPLYDLDEVCAALS